MSLFNTVNLITAYYSQIVTTHENGLLSDYMIQN